MLAFKLLRDCRSYNLGLNFAQSDTLTLSSYKNSIKVRMIIISFIHITDKKRNITRNYGKVVTRNTEFTSAMVTLELHFAQELEWQTFTQFFSGILKYIYLKLKTNVFLRLFTIVYLWSNMTFNKLWCLTLRALVSTLQGNKYKYLTKPNDTHIF